MRFLSMVKSAEALRDEEIPQALMEAMGKLIGEAMETGVLADAGGLLPSSKGTEFRIKGSKLTVKDGPFTEAKEVVGGYAVYQVNSREEAVEWTKRFMALHMEHWPEWEGACELRELEDFPD